MKKIFVLAVAALMISCGEDQSKGEFSQEDIQGAGDFTPDAFSEFVPQSDAAAVAQSWMGQRTDYMRHSYEIRNIIPTVVRWGNQEIVTSYSVNFEEGGFAIVAADSAIDPILGYSQSGSIDEESDNPAFAEFMEDLNLKVRDTIVYLNRFDGMTPMRKIDEARIAANIAKWDALLDNSYTPRAEAETVEPLIDAHWNQGDPYNRFTPMDNGMHSVVGCVAVAIAQVVHYWAHPVHGAGYHQYSWTGSDGVQQTLRADYGKAEYDWSLMPDSLTEAGVTEEEKDETARFLYHTGVGVNMNYGSGVSVAGTSSSEYLMERHYRFADSSRFVWRSGYSNIEWVNLMKTELLEGRPIIYRGNAPSASVGHAFNLDGLDADGLFHINWGWGGSQDGYFVMDDNGPGNYPAINGALIGAHVHAAAQGEECGGWGGYPCSDGLACKNRGEDMAGQCQPEQWCDADTVAADCSGLDHPPTAGDWECQDNECVWTENTGPGTVTVTDAGYLARYQWRHYGPFSVPTGGDIVATLAMTSGDGDLYVNEGSQPTKYVWDCRPYKSGTQTETCSFDGPGEFYVSIYGYYATNFTLTITYGAEGQGTPGSVCGNGQIEGAETCDGSGVACAILDPLSFISGTATCASTCDTYDAADCVFATCGDGVLESPAEECESGSEYMDCSGIDPKYNDGIANCEYSTCYWNRYGCTEYVCGNGIPETTLGEKCDGNTIECVEIDPLNYASGTATCNSNCLQWDTGSCVIIPRCGNSVVEPDNGEICDRNTIDCYLLDPDLWGGGYASCNSTCDGWDTTYCEGPAVCGDGMVRPPEVCDGDTAPCEKLYPDLYIGGTATCNATCDDWIVDECIGNSAPAQVTVHESGYVSRRQWKHYGPFEALDGEFLVEMTGTNDADLYVNEGSQPTSSNYDCRPYLWGSDETCALEGPGNFYVSVYGYAASSFELDITYYTNP